MPRAFLKTKNRGGHHVYTCTVCGDPIEAGQKYYTWKFNHGSRYFQHAEHGHPKPSQLSNSKMGPVWDAVNDADFGKCEDVEEIKGVLAEVASVARDVGQEYTDSADNIESSFPSGNPTSEACRETGEALESWADELENWEPTEDSFDEDAFKEDHEGDKDDLEDELAEARETWLEDRRDEARQLLEEQPEYTG